MCTKARRTKNSWKQEYNFLYVNMEFIRSVMDLFNVNDFLHQQNPPKCSMDLALLDLLSLGLSPLSQLIGGHSLELSTVKHG